MTTDDLRDRLARELDVLQPPPDLVPGALRAGSRVVRRRRLAAGSLLGALGVGAAIAVPMALDAHPQGVTPVPAGEPDSSLEPDPSPGPPTPFGLGDTDVAPASDAIPGAADDQDPRPGFLGTAPSPGGPVSEAAPADPDPSPSSLGSAPTPSGR